MAIGTRDSSLPWSPSRPSSIPTLEVPSSQTPAQDPSATSNEMREDLRRFAGRNAQPFLDVYDAGRTGWRSRCWPGFFFPAIWFLYRKLYGLAAFAIFWPVVWAFVEVPSSWNTAISLVPSFLGMRGRRLYVDKASKIIVQIRKSASNEEDALASIEAAGGVSIGGAIFGSLLLAGFVGLALIARLAKH